MQRRPRPTAQRRMRESARAFSQHMRPKKTALHLEDLLIVLNFVNANESFKESECAALACLRAVPARSCLVSGRRVHSEE